MLYYLSLLTHTDQLAFFNFEVDVVDRDDGPSVRSHRRHELRDVETAPTTRLARNHHPEAPRARGRREGA